jgi:hypothetical protein
LEIKIMSVEWIEHKGKRILLIDHSGLELEAVIENLELVDKIMLEFPPDAKLLHLSNFEGVMINVTVLARLKESGKAVVEPRTEKAAVVGLSSLQHILLASYNRFTGAGKRQKVFDTQEEALEWLLS